MDNIIKEEESLNVSSMNYANRFLPLDKQKSYFSELFKNINGYQVSYEDKKKLELFENKTFTYSEVEFDGFKEILEVIDLPKNYTFFDCGSGLGKALILASLLTPCNKVVGREKLPTLVEESNVILTNFTNYLKSDTPNVLIPEFDVKQDSFLNYNFQDVNLVFANSTCFDDDLMNSLIEKLSVLVEGSYVITVTRQIDHSNFECIHKSFYKMNWGSPTVYVYKKI